MKMLRVTLFACALLLPSVAQAQSYPTAKGSLLLSGNASLASQGDDQDDDEERTTTIFINPSGQFFVIPGLAVGGTVSFSYVSQDEFSSTGVGAGPSISYFFGRGQRKVYPFIAASFILSESSFETFSIADGTLRDESATSYTFNASGGAVLMIAKNVGFTGELFYRESHTDFDGDLPRGDNDFENNSFGLRFGIAAFVF